MAAGEGPCVSLGQDGKVARGPRALGGVLGKGIEDARRPRDGEHEGKVQVAPLKGNGDAGERDDGEDERVDRTFEEAGDREEGERLRQLDEGGVTGEGPAAGGGDGQHRKEHGQDDGRDEAVGASHLTIVADSRHDGDRRGTRRPAVAALASVLAVEASALVPACVLALG